MERGVVRTRTWSVLLGLALTAGAVACTGGGPAGPPDPAGVELIGEAEIAAAGDLADLTEEQRERVRAILREARAELMALRRAVRAGEIDPEAARARAREIHAGVIEALSEILTDEQIDHLFDRLRDRRPDDRPDLDLTAEQLEAIRAIRAELRETIRAIRERFAAGEIPAEEARALVREAWVEAHEAICAVLTGEQAAEVRFCSGDGVPPGPGGRGGPGSGGGPPGDGPAGG